MKSFWNKRYDTDEYIYGVYPNTFFKEKVTDLPPGKLLLPGEGEGRNAVYAAEKGWQVTAFDSAEQARIKAMRLADARQVHINYQVMDITDANFDACSYDMIALTFVHLHENLRKNFHRKAITWLKPGGILLMEVFSVHQIFNKSGGPQNLQLLYTEADLLEDLSGLMSSWTLENLTININEGNHHKGWADVIRYYGIK